MYDKTLLFSPHVFLFAMLFYNRAFAAYNLTLPEELNRLTISLSHNEPLLRLDWTLDHVPVFRKAVQTLHGWDISPNEPLPFPPCCRGSGREARLRGLLKSPVLICCNMPEGRLLIKTVRPTIYPMHGVGCRIKVSLGQCQQGYAEPDDGPRQHSNILEALSLTAHHN
jgi:hypothetical protein